MELGLDELRCMMAAVSEKIIENEGYLTELDTLIGDGDHGKGMKRGFTALKDMLSKEEFEEPAALMRASGIELLKTIGGASGVLFGTLFISGVESLNDIRRVDLMVFAKYMDKGVRSICERGNTAQGEKTMVDALIPAVGALEAAAKAGLDLNEGLSVAYSAAAAGAEATKDMIPVKGRAKNFAKKALGVPDPGAVSVTLIFEAMYEYTSEKEKG